MPKRLFFERGRISGFFERIIIKISAFFLIFILSIGNASAASLTNMSDTLSSARIGTASNHSFVFTTPTGIAAGSTTLITFPDEFVIPFALSFTDVDINIGGAYTGSSTLGSAPSGATVGVARVSTTTLLITNGTTPITAGNTVYIRIGTNALHQTTGVNQIVNATTTGNKSIGITGGTTTPMFDSGTTTVNMITNDTVTISAIVLQSLTFSISTTTLSFGNLSNVSAKYASSTNANGDTVETIAHTLGVSTNAPAGYSITVQGQTLTSQQYATNTISAIGQTPATYAVGTEQFGIYATKAGGINGTIDSTYATPSSFGYDATATTSAVFAFGTSPTNTETFSLRYLASISALTEAGTYSANLVYVGTANF